MILGLGLDGHDCLGLGLGLGLGMHLHARLVAGDTRVFEVQQ